MAGFGGQSPQKYQLIACFCKGVETKSQSPRSGAVFLSEYPTPWIARPDLSGEQSRFGI